MDMHRRRWKRVCFNCAMVNCQCRVPISRQSSAKLSDISWHHVFPSEIYLGSSRFPSPDSFSLSFTKQHNTRKADPLFLNPCNACPLGTRSFQLTWLCHILWSRYFISSLEHHSLCNTSSSQLSTIYPITNLALAFGDIVPWPFRRVPRVQLSSFSYRLHKT